VSLDISLKKLESHDPKAFRQVPFTCGYKNSDNTLIYIHLVDFKDDGYVSKVAATAEEACKLMEASFEFVCEINGANMLCKRE